jgi:hypothetical protein
MRMDVATGCVQGIRALMLWIHIRRMRTAITLCTTRENKLGGWRCGWCRHRCRRLYISNICRRCMEDYRCCDGTGSFFA